MTEIHYVGFDVHKKTISYCKKTASGEIVDQGVIRSTRGAIENWCRQQTVPWHGVLEATLFSGWMYDVLKPHAAKLLMADPRRLKAISGAKKKTDALDAATLADLLRCNIVPDCYVAPPAIRELRRKLRYRSLIVRQAVQMKNRTAGLLMEVGAEYNKKKLHGERYFAELLENLTDVPDSVIELLRYSRAASDLFARTQKQLVKQLKVSPLLQQRVALLQTIPGVGEITALTWALEIGTPRRFPSIGDACSYCGLTSAFRVSAGKQQRGPISKQRNPHLQTILVEAANLAPRWNPLLKQEYEKERKKGGHANQATLAVARKLVAYLMAVDRSRQPFRMPVTEPEDKDAANSKATC